MFFFLIVKLNVTPPLYFCIHLVHISVYCLHVPKKTRLLSPTHRLDFLDDVIRYIRARTCDLKTMVFLFLKQQD